jgi:hypothetical protein
MRSLFPFRLGVEKKREMSIPGTNATTRHLLLTDMLGSSSSHFDPIRTLVRLGANSSYLDSGARG